VFFIYVNISPPLYHCNNIQVSSSFLDPDTFMIGVITHLTSRQGMQRSSSVCTPIPSSPKKNVIIKNIKLNDLKFDQIYIKNTNIYYIK